MNWRRPLFTAFIAFLLLPGIFSPALAADIVFLDVTTGNPHYQAIQALAQKGVIQGYADQSFRPDQPVNRAEAVKLVLLGSDIFAPEIDNGTELFPDVMPGVWYDKFVAKAKNLGVIRGDSETGFFRPGDTVNLAEVLKIILETNTIVAKTPNSNPYLDVPADAWFGPYFAYAKLAKLLDQTSDENVNPASAVNRGMLAELMYRLSRAPKADEYGKASYYAGRFHGKTTASGDVFDASNLTAAHRTYPFGTWLKVTNTENGKSVTVRVNDRGPYGNSERIVDLSKAAFESIASLSRGVIFVTIEVTEAPSETPAPSNPTPTPAPEVNDLLTAQMPQTCPDRQGETVSATAFQDFVLDQALPDRFVTDELVRISGKTTSTEKIITVVLRGSDGVPLTFPAPVDAEGQFIAHFSFPAPGNYELGMIPGLNGSTNLVPVKSLSYACLSEKEQSSLLPPPLPTIGFDEGWPQLQWDKGNYNAFQLTFSQGEQFKKVLLDDEAIWRPVFSEFSGFTEGPVQVILRGINRPTSSFLTSGILAWSKPQVFTLSAVTHHDYLVKPEEITVTGLPTTTSLGDFIRFSFNTKTAIRSQAAFILPDGEVETVDLKASVQPIKNKNNLSVFPTGTSNVTLSYRVHHAGLHFLEINNAEGLAAINIPLYPAGSFPLLPNPTDFKESLMKLDVTKVPKEFLDLVNQDRQAQVRSKVTLDDSLSALAQARAEDMVKNHYFGHWNPNGQSVNELRSSHGITQTVSENLAQEQTPALAHYGLLRSAIHRASILNSEWTRLGIGVAENEDGSYIFVELFSAEPFNLSNVEALRSELLTAINKKRSTPLAADPTLTDFAQNWCATMVQRDFFDFTDPDGQSLFDILRAASVTHRLGTYLVGNTSFSSARDQILRNTAIVESNWQQIGIGILQDNLGIFKITLLYSE
ncbi:MAG: septal ring lytic transglycosylase RlpA family protein [Candidatus Peregrinibacteria bacterium]